VSKKDIFQPELFEGEIAPLGPNNTYVPLAYKARPKDFEHFKGHDYLFKRYPFLRGRNFPNLILWGPPGTGKTTLAYLLAGQSSKDLYPFSAVLGGVQELKKLIAHALEIKRNIGNESIIFIDEIHRFNKAQQDALLPYVEDGSFILIGATTEHPRRSINPALLSRISIIELKPLAEDALLEIISNVNQLYSLGLKVEVLKFIADYSNRDARIALNLIEVLQNNYPPTRLPELEVQEVTPLLLENCRSFDRNGDRHYDVISAFIKSLRGSDPDAALLWLAVMLDGGEDPVFVARRLVIFASEDIGNADPGALSLAVAALTAVQSIGMPEGRINLAQAVTYLASTVKSNAAYEGINEALEYVSTRQTVQVPNHLKNYPPKGTKDYLYPHRYPGHFVHQDYTIEKIPQFYRPTEIGKEKNIKDRLNNLWPEKF